MSVNNIVRILIILLILSASAEAFWPFDKKYLAKINDEIITKDDFRKKLEKYHTVKDIGKKMPTNIAKVDHRKILNEMIDERLMIQEALRIALDKTFKFINAYNLFKLNLSLSMLRKEMVIDKIIISDKMISNRSILEQKTDMEYKTFLKNKADIRIYNNELKSIKINDLSGGAEKTIATVNGEPIKRDDLIISLKRLKRSSSRQEWTEVKESALNSLINQRLLDIEALAKNYAKTASFQEALPPAKDSILLKLFKNDFLVKSTKFDITEVEKYYENHVEEFRTPEKVRLSVIEADNKTIAQEAVIELQNGADFVTIASDITGGNSAPKMETGWILSNILAPNIRKKLNDMKPGIVYGPFNFDGKFFIVKFHERKQEYPPKFKDIAPQIINTLRKKIYGEFMIDYIERLRAVSNIDINKSALNSFIKKK